MRPDLLTLRAAELIRSADVIVYDNLVSYAVLRMADENAELIFAGKRGGGSGNVPQAEINRILIEQAERGQARRAAQGWRPVYLRARRRRSRGAARGGQSTMKSYRGSVRRSQCRPSRESR